MARDLGGSGIAQLVAAFAALPACLAIGSMMQYVSFDYLAWVLVSSCIVRLLKTEDPRWWVGVGASIGFGMLSNHAFLCQRNYCRRAVNARPPPTCAAAGFGLELGPRC
jgi:hypothetical protein